MTQQQLISSIADAIDRMEGPGVQRNNPGNLRSWGSLPTSGGFAVFPTLEEGRAALERQIALNINRGLTLEEFFAGKPGVYPGYAPSADRNDPVNYARNVSNWTGIPLGVPISQVIGGTGGTGNTQTPEPNFTLPPVTFPSPGTGVEQNIPTDLSQFVDYGRLDADGNPIFSVDAFGDLSESSWSVGLIILAAAALLYANSQ